MTDGTPGDQDEAFSKEAFMAAIVKLADDEAFRRSFMEHYNKWLYPPMLLTRDLEGFTFQPGHIEFVDEETLKKLTPFNMLQRIKDKLEADEVARAS